MRRGRQSGHDPHTLPPTAAARRTEASTHLSPPLLSEGSEPGLTHFHAQHGAQSTLPNRCPAMLVQTTQGSGSRVVTTQGLHPLARNQDGAAQRHVGKAVRDSRPIPGCLGAAEVPLTADGVLSEPEGLPDRLEAPAGACGLLTARRQQRRREGGGRAERLQPPSPNPCTVPPGRPRGRHRLVPREPTPGRSQPWQPYCCPGSAAALAGAQRSLPTGERPSALEQRSGLEGPLCTGAGPPAPGSTTERLPGVRLRQGVGRKTQGQLASTVWVQPCWSSTGTDETSGIYSRSCCGKQLPMLVRWDSSFPGWRSPRPSPSRGFLASNEVRRVLRMQSREGIRGALVETRAVCGAQPGCESRARSGRWAWSSHRRGHCQSQVY